MEALIRRIVQSAALAALLVAGMSFAYGQESPVPSPSASPLEIAKERIDTMLRTGHSDPAWFSASFLSKAPASKIDEIVASLKQTLGEYRSVEYTPTRFLAHFAKGTDDILIHLDAQNKIDGLFFRPPAVSAGDINEGLKSLAQEGSTLAYAIEEEGRSETAALNASMPLAVGSTFKLAVLNALNDLIASGKKHWADVVPFQARWKSLPSGVLQNWPDATPITLATYAAEMISISDNTAADALVHIVGSAALRPYAGANQPFLTTRQAFVLKSKPKLRDAYLAAKTPAARRAVVNEADAAPLPQVFDIAATPSLDIEWHYSVRDLCRLMRRVADLPSTSINPGVAQREMFRHVAYKGGSEPGAINMTTAVTTKRGTKICFSATLNNKEKSID
ncbi:MAG: serine hydrolase, partial [Vulcanimicrobiaceae bacterium]